MYSIWEIKNLSEKCLFIYFIFQMSQDLLRLWFFKNSDNNSNSNGHQRRVPTKCYVLCTTRSKNHQNQRYCFRIGKFFLYPLRIGLDLLLSQLQRLSSESKVNQQVSHFRNWKITSISNAFVAKAKISKAKIKICPFIIYVRWTELWCCCV